MDLLTIILTSTVVAILIIFLISNLWGKAAARASVCALFVVLSLFIYFRYSEDYGKGMLLLTVAVFHRGLFSGKF